MSRSPVSPDPPGGALFAAGNGGFWRVYHEHLAAVLARGDLTWEFARVYFALADLTIGYGKDKDVVSIGQLAELSGLGSTAHVCRALRELGRRGIVGSEPAGGQRVRRWVVWPPPTTAGMGSTTGGTTAGMGTAKATAGMGSSSTAVAGSSATAKATAATGRHQYIQEGKEVKDTKRGSAALPPTPSETPEASGDGVGGRLMAAWVDGWTTATQQTFPKGARGRTAGELKRLATDYPEADLVVAVERWFGQNRKTYGVGMFARKLQDGDADLRDGGDGDGDGLPAGWPDPPWRETTVEDLAVGCGCPVEVAAMMRERSCGMGEAAAILAGNETLAASEHVREQAELAKLVARAEAACDNPTPWRKGAST